MIIDAHCHAGELERHFHRTFAQSMMHSIDKPPEAITTHIPDLIADMDASHIDKAFLLAFDAERTLGVKVPNDYVAEICRAYPERFIGFGSVDAGAAGAAEEVQRCTNVLGLRGLKIAPAYVRLAPDNRAWYPIYEMAAALRLPVLMHTGWTPAHGAVLRFGQPQPALHQVAKDFPGLSIILAHMSMPWVDQCLELLATHPHLYADLSIFGWYQPVEVVGQVLVHAREKHVIERILWGTDHPWGPRATFLARMERLRNEASLFPDGQTLLPTEWDNIMGIAAWQLVA